MLSVNQDDYCCKGSMALGNGCGSCRTCMLWKAMTNEDQETSSFIAQHGFVAQLSEKTKVNVQADQWDEKQRGKKMSSNSGKVIFKYQMPVQERFTMKLPKGSEILRVADQDGFFWLWAVVDTREPDEDRHFVAVKCGANVPEGRTLRYIGMCAIFVQQELALYIFEDKTNA